MSQVDGGLSQGLAIVPKERTKLPPRPADGSLFDRYVTQSRRNTEHSRVGRCNRVVACEQQHAMRAGGIELTKQAERSAGTQERSADGCRQRPVAPEDFSAGPERIQPQLSGWAGRGNGHIQGRPGRTDDRIWREDMGFSKGGERGVAPGRQGSKGEHLPGK